MAHGVKSSLHQACSRFCLSLLVGGAALLQSAPKSALAQAPAETETAQKPANLKVHELLGYDVDLTDRYVPDIENAIELFLGEGMVKESFEALEAAIAKEPNLPPIEVMQAKLFSRAGKNPQAQLLLENAAKSKPEDPEALLLLAESVLRLGHTAVPQACYDTARGLINKMNGNEPRKTKLQIRLISGYAAIAERRRDWDQTIKLLNYLARVEKEPVLIYQRLGSAYFQNEKESEAYAAFEKAAQLNEELADPRIMLAQLLRTQGKFDEALRYVEEAMRQPDANLQTRLGVGLFLTLSDQIDQAGPYVETTLKEYPDSVDAQVLAGILARYRRDYTRAQARFEAAQRLGPDNFMAANLVALTNFASADEAERKKGIALAEENVRRFPQNRDAHIALGWIYFKLGRGEEAGKLIDPALRGFNPGPDSAYFVASILFAQQRWDDARKLLDAALKSQALFVHREEAKALMGKLDIERLRASVAPK